MKPVSKYFRDVDIYSLYFMDNKVEHSLEILNGQILLDFDKKGRIVGIDINDFSSVMKEAIIKNNKLWEKLDKASSKNKEKTK